MGFRPATDEEATDALAAAKEVGGRGYDGADAPGRGEDEISVAKAKAQAQAQAGSGGGGDGDEKPAPPWPALMHLAAFGPMDGEVEMMWRIRIWSLNHSRVTVGPTDGELSHEAPRVLLRACPSLAEGFHIDHDDRAIFTYLDPASGGVCEVRTFQKCPGIYVMQFYETYDDGARLIIREIGMKFPEHTQIATARRFYKRIAPPPVDGGGSGVAE